jgi:class 3 adenylate cyclase
MENQNPSYVYHIDEYNQLSIKYDQGIVNAFNPSLLSIGDITLPSKPVDVLAAIFDLEGFTNFTKQIDPQLSIPNFINDFCQWMFSTLSKEMVRQKPVKSFWAELPFFAKFLGDGILFLWRIDSEKISETYGQKSQKVQSYIYNFLANTIVSLNNVCGNQYVEFYEKAAKRYVDPPDRLRCGIARGFVFPIGGGLDYVGACINLASRLQNFNGLSFAFSVRGLDLDAFAKSAKKNFVVTKCDVRGIGNRELIAILKEEFEELSDEQKKKFKIV